MTALGDMILLRPLWLVGLVLVTLLTVVVLRHRRSLAGWRDLIEPRLLEFLETRGQVLVPRGGGIGVLFASIAVFAALGLSGPAARKSSAPSFRNLEVVFLLVDLSQSMTRGGNLEDAKAAAALVLAEAGTRPVALALYAGESYLVSPPTSDPAMLETMISVLDDHTLPDSGTRPDRALILARQTIAEAEARQADLIIVSDGGGIGPEADHAARVLREEGVRVSAVYVAPSETPYGMPAPNRDAMARLAEAGGGLLTDATDTATLTKLLRDARSRPTADSEIVALLFDDFGRWFLWPALVPALLLFRRRTKA